MDTTALVNDGRLAWSSDMTPGKPLMPYRGDLKRLFPKVMSAPSFADAVRSAGIVSGAELGQFLAEAKSAPGVEIGDEKQCSVSLLCHNPTLFARMNNALLDRNVLELLKLRWLLYKVLEGLRAAPSYVSEGQLYRCVLKRISVRHLVPGRIFAWHGFTFVHTSSLDARKLLWDSKTRTYDSTMFVIRGLSWGHDVSKYVPELLGESKGRLILLEPERQFRVIRVTVGSPILVDIEMCPSEPTLIDLIPMQDRVRWPEELRALAPSPTYVPNGFAKDRPGGVTGSGKRDDDVRVKQAVRGAMRLALEANDTNIFNVPIQHIMTQTEWEAQHLSVAVRKELTQKEIDEELDAVLNEVNKDGPDGKSGGWRRDDSAYDNSDDSEQKTDLSQLPLWKRLFLEQPTAASVEPNARALSKEAEDEIEFLTKSIELMCNPNIILPESETMQEIDQILQQQQNLFASPPTVANQEPLPSCFTAEDLQEDEDIEPVVSHAQAPDSSISAEMPVSSEERRGVLGLKANENRGSLSLAQQMQQREKKHHGVWTKIRTHFASSASTALPNAQTLAVAAKGRMIPDLLLMVKRAQNLTEFPEVIHFSQTLQVLDLSHNRLMKVSDEFGELKALKVLDLSDNSLTSIPNTISEMKDLVAINLERNWLAMVPECLSSLSSLRSLNLDNNQLSSFPASLSTLPVLQELSLAENEILELADALLEMPSLIVLTVVKNPCADYLRGKLLRSGFPII